MARTRWRYRPKVRFHQWRISWPDETAFEKDFFRGRWAGPACLAPVPSGAFLTRIHIDYAGGRLYDPKSSSLTLEWANRVILDGYISAASVRINHSFWHESFVLVGSASFSNGLSPGVTVTRGKSFWWALVKSGSYAR